MKKVKITTIILVIILVSMIAFGGIFVIKKSSIDNVIKDYTYSMDLDESRNIVYKIDDNKNSIIKDKDGNIVKSDEELTDEQIKEKGYVKEEIPVNSQESLNLENYKNSKKIMEKRLKKLGVTAYNIRLDEESGKIYVEIPEDEFSEDVMGSLSSIGKFELSDAKSGNILMDNNDIKGVNVVYGNDQQTQPGQKPTTSVYLNIEFDKEGKKKLEDISKEYHEIEKPEENEEEKPEENKEDKPEEKQVTLKLDNEEIMTTAFKEPITNGILQLSVGQPASDVESLQENAKKGTNVAVTIDSGITPVAYLIEKYEVVKSDITKDMLNNVGYIFASIVLIALVYMIVKYKMNGLLGAISYIGLGSLFALLIRYANVIISIEGIFGIAIVLVLNYILINRLLEKSKTEKVNKELFKEIYKEFLIKIIPVCIAVVSLCFIAWTSISSFGMIMFWGILLIVFYNMLITDTLLKIKAEK